MLKPENNPYSRKYKGPPMCSCCDTLPAIESKDLCHSCHGLTNDECDLVHMLLNPTVPESNKGFHQMSLSPEILDWYDLEF
jgi:hypothetical protein